MSSTLLSQRSASIFTSKKRVGNALLLSAITGVGLSACSTLQTNTPVGSGNDQQHG